MTKVHASLFSGFGAADLAAKWMGWDNAFWCEIDDFPRTVLSYWFPQSIGYGNIKDTDFTPWRGKIDVLTGGFPCQPFSVAGQRKGADDDRYLWPEMLRAIREIRPTWIIGENVNGILSMVQPGNEVTVESQASLFEENDKETILEQEYIIETVCRSIEQEGYSVQPIVIPACGVEAPHLRYRVFFLAHSTDTRFESLQQSRENRVCGFEPSANANSYDDRRSGYGQIGCETGKGEATERKRKRFRDDIKRIGKKGVTSDTKSQQSKRMQFRQSEYSQQKQRKFRGKNSGSNSTLEERGHAQRTFKHFPTQPPVCRGNDGLPFDVGSLTISFTAWRTGSIKGYGNAIVPQVMYEIFKALEEVEQLA